MNANQIYVVYVNLSLLSPIPVQIGRFWACSKDISHFQILNRRFFREKACDVENIVLSDYVTDADGPQDCIEIQNDKQMVEMNCSQVLRKQMQGLFHV